MGEHKFNGRRALLYEHKKLSECKKLFKNNSALWSQNSVTKFVDGIPAFAGYHSNVSIEGKGQSSSHHPRSIQKLSGGWRRVTSLGRRYVRRVTSLGHRCVCVE